MKRKILISLIVVFILLLSQYKLLFTSYAHFFTVDNATVGADAIVVLSGGILIRAPHAIRLHSKGYGKRVILTNERPRNLKLYKYFASDFQIANKISDILNIPVNFEKVPSLKNGATSTLDEAHDLLAFCTKEGIKHLIIVTDGFHTRRALYAFKKVFQGGNVKLEISGAKNDIFNEENWWQSDYGIAAYILEPIKLIVYLFVSENVTFVKND